MISFKGFFAFNILLHSDVGEKVQMLDKKQHNLGTQTKTVYNVMVYTRIYTILINYAYIFWQFANIIWFRNIPLDGGTLPVEASRVTFLVNHDTMYHVRLKWSTTCSPRVRKIFGSSHGKVKPKTILTLVLVALHALSTLL